MGGKKVDISKMWNKIFSQSFVLKTPFWNDVK